MPLFSCSGRLALVTQARSQRKVARAIKRAQHLGLISFDNGEYSVTNPYEPEARTCVSIVTFTSLSQNFLLATTPISNSPYVSRNDLLFLL